MSIYIVEKNREFKKYICFKRYITVYKMIDFNNIDCGFYLCCAEIIIRETC